MQPDGPALLLLVATAVHLGFQLVVTALVYPVFTEVPDRQWAAYHDRHSSRIGPLVVAVYGLLVIACGWALVAGPGSWEVAAVGACAAAGALTAGVAAPAHGRLGRLGPDPATLRRLLVADRLRLVAAVLALGLAVAAAAA